jgi:hypothetical protein
MSDSIPSSTSQYEPGRVGGDHLVGDVAIVGAERRGEMTDVADDLITLLLESRRYQVEVLLG